MHYEIKSKMGSSLKTPKELQKLSLLSVQLCIAAKNGKFYRGNIANGLNRWLCLHAVHCRRR